jgi:hypothetical protein
MIAEPHASMDALTSTVTRALMDGAFVFCVPTHDVSPLAGDVVVASVRLRTEGRPALVTELQFPADFARQLALDTVGETDPDAVSDDDARDTLLELANVVAGGLASSVVPAGRLCRIDPPEPRSLAPASASVSALLTDGGARVRILLGAESA